MAVWFTDKTGTVSRQNRNFSPTKTEVEETQLLIEDLPFCPRNDTDGTWTGRKVFLYISWPELRQKSNSTEKQAEKENYKSLKTNRKTLVHS